jgi:hypothetical protein
MRRGGAGIRAEVDHRIPVPNERVRWVEERLLEPGVLLAPQGDRISSDTRPLRTSLVCSPETPSSIWSVR